MGNSINYVRTSRIIPINYNMCWVYNLIHLVMCLLLENRCFPFSMPDTWTMTPWTQVFEIRLWINMIKLQDPYILVFVSFVGAPFTRYCSKHGPCGNHDFIISSILFVSLCWTTIFWGTTMHHDATHSPLDVPP